MQRKPTDSEVEQLQHAATAAVRNAHVPYSNVPVGVSVLTDKGIVSGAAVENCAYPNSVCGVRATVLSAIAEGATEFLGMAVVTEGPTSLDPCGSCLEFCREFGEFPVWIRSTGREKFTASHTSILLPTIEPQPPTLFQQGRGRDDTLDFDSPFTMHPNVAVPDGMTEKEFFELCVAAVRACKNAYVPVSNFPVGAAILTTDGKTITGCNVEHAKIGLTLCAERCALCRMVSKGSRDVKCLAVSCAKLPDYGRPCGGCRQSMVEFEDYPVYQTRVDWENRTIDVEPTTSLKQLPNAFTPAALRSAE